MRFQFEVQSRQASARAGLLKFNAQTLETPVFMPVGTRASVKAVSQENLEEIGYQLILTNTYHLYLRPGTLVLKEFGGVKNFMAWPHLMLTDSGGFQAFSLSSLTQYLDNGIHFKSHLDGSSHLFTPEKVLDIQSIIGSDIVMPLDDCAPYPADEKRLREALTRTHQWLQQSKQHWEKTGYENEQSLFGIVQGGVKPELRRESAQFAASLNLPGYSIGGLSVGENISDFQIALSEALPHLPEEKPRYLMGVGSIPEILYAVSRGVDMFDCVLPTRNARNGQVFTSAGKLNIRAEYNKFQNKPVDENCECRVCRRYSLGYLRHLHKTQELLAYELSSYHNLYFMHRFMGNLRQSIIDEKLEEFVKHYTELFSD